MAMSFKTKIIGSVVVPTIVLIILGAVALAFNVYSEQNKAATEKVQSDLDSVQRLLQESARLMTTKTTTAMSILEDISSAAGSASAGDSLVIVPGVSAPNISFGKEAQAGNFRIVDKVTQLAGGTATIFSKSDGSFVRITTNVKKQDGSRAVGTVLDPEGPAFAAIMDNREYEGVVDILGNPFFTIYKPMMDSQNKLIGIYYVGYEASLASVEAAVGKTRILKTGFLALVDSKGKVRFSTQGISPEQAESTIKSVPAGWSVNSRDVAGWGYKVYAAYPRSELREGALTTAATIIGGGLVLALVLSVLVGLLIESMVVAPLGGEPSQASAAMAVIAAGNLDVEIGQARPGSLLNNLSLMQEKLRNIVNAIHKSVAKSREQHDRFEEALKAFLNAKNEGPDKQKLTEDGLIAAAQKVAKSDDSVSRAVERLKL
jgi:methyl-accepting chemotaxis protein